MEETENLEQVVEQKETSTLDQVAEVQPEEVKEEPKEESIVEKPNTDREDNLKALRESRRKIQQEKEALEARLLAMESQKNQQPQVDEYLDEEDETRKELKEVKKYVSQMQVNNERLRLQANYPDFKNVVNEESIAILKERFPEVARTLDQGTDIYSTGSSAYNIIKKFGIHIEDNYSKQKENINKNISKPIPSNTVKNTSPLSYANDYSDLEDASVRAEIIKQARKIAGSY